MDIETDNESIYDQDDDAVFELISNDGPYVIDYIDPKYEITKHTIAPIQICKLHSKIAIRSRMSNLDEIITSFDKYSNTMGIFTQQEVTTMRITMMKALETINFRQYSILVPLFFIYSFCISKGICFPKSWMKKVCLEVYTKKSCLDSMKHYMGLFNTFLDVRTLGNYPWYYYIRGLILIIRSIVFNKGQLSNISFLTTGDNEFLTNTYEDNSQLKVIYEKIKIISYRIMTIGLMKFNAFNEIDFDKMFDLHIHVLLEEVERDNILSKDVMVDLREVFDDQLYNHKLASLCVLERESYIMNRVTECSLLSNYSKTK
jgi:hypothetical protein